MIPYIAYVSILFAATFIVYWLFLRKETFYKINRFFLIGAIIASLVIPLMTVPAYISLRPPVVEVFNTIQTERIIGRTPTNNEVLSKSTEAPVILKKIESISEKELLIKPSETNDSWFAMLSTVNWRKILWFVYLIGVTIFTITFLIQFTIILLQKRKLQYIQDGKFRIYELTENASPFSFMRWIFINPELYDYETYCQILEHEKIHVAQVHYFDKMLAEFAVIFNWFNPFVWMYRKAITNNLEFLTDFEMIGKGTVPEIYQMSLLKVSVPQHGLNLTTNYNESFLSERIKMMNAKKSSARSSWKYLLIFPLLGLSMATLNAVKPISELTSSVSAVDSDQENEITKISSKKSNLQTYTKKDLAVANDIDSDGMLGKNNNTVTTTINNTTKTTNVDKEAALAASISEAREAIEGQIVSKVIGSVMTNNNSSYKDNNFTGFEKFMSEFEESMKNMGEEFKNADVSKYNDISEKYSKQLSQDIGKGFGESLGQNLGKQIENELSKHIDIEYKNEDEPTVANAKKNNSNTQASAQASAQSNAQSSAQSTAQSKSNASFSNNKIRPGKWEGKVDGEDLCLNLSYKNNHNTSFCIKISEIRGFVDGNEVTFQMIRDAGTLTLDGSFKRKNGDGSFEFVEDENFKSFIKNALNVDRVKDEDLFMLFITDIDRSFVKAVIESGHNVSVDDLVEFGIFEIDESKLNEFDRIAKKLGEKRISPKRMVEMQIHGVDEHFVNKVLQNKDRKASYEDLLNAKIHNVDPELPKALDRYGFQNIPFEKLIDMEIHNVSPQYVKELSALGLSNLSASKLIEFKIHGVKAKDIAAFQKMRLEDITPSNIVSAKIHGVNKRYAESIMASGAKGINLDNLKNAKIHGVTADFISRANRKGHDNKTLSKYIDLKIHGL